MSKKGKISWSILLPIILIVVSIYMWLAVFYSKGRTATRLTYKLADEQPMSSYIILAKNYSNFDADDPDVMDSVATHLHERTDRKFFADGLVRDYNDSYELVPAKRILGLVTQYKLKFKPITLTIISDVPKFTVQIGADSTFEKPEKISKIDYYGVTAYKTELVIYPTESDEKTKITIQDNHYSQNKKALLDKNRTLILPIYE